MHHIIDKCKNKSNIFLTHFNNLKNKYIDQYLDVVFKNETIITMMGKNLNGTIKIDQTNFVKINLNNTRFNIDEINFMQSSSIRDINNIEVFNWRKRRMIKIL